MRSDEKILKALEVLQIGQARLEKTVTALQADMSDMKQDQKEQGSVIARLEQGQGRLEQGQAQTKTMLKVLEAGQNDIRENMATKADMQDIKVDLVKHQRRLENLEESTKTPNPHKN